LTREETKALIKAMKTGWSNYRPEDLTETVNLWASVLEPYPFPAVFAALKAYMLGNHAFAPAPGQLVAQFPKREGGSELEAWGKVRKALRNGNYGAEEEFAKLPEDIQEALGSPEQLRAWAMAPESETETVMQSNFLRSYRIIRERRERVEYLPEDVIKALEVMRHGVEELPG